MNSWVWEQGLWPNFKFDIADFAMEEALFLQKSNFLAGALTHLTKDTELTTIIDIASNEAFKTSEIEGEILNRESIRASLRKGFGLIDGTNKSMPPAERGVAKIMQNVYQDFASKLSAEILCEWNLELLSYRFDLDNIGTYRQHLDPMQIVSNTGYRQRVHYEAPPSKNVPYEMEKYIDWFNNCELPALTKASIAHVYFELIHPFTDGNGRIGRALVIKSLAQSLQQPIMLALSRIIERNKKEYYTNIAACNHNLKITEWVKYFSNVILKAQEYSIDYVKFIIAKAKLFDRVTNLINERQRKVINRILQEGPDDFVGGMSADKYIAITQTSRATATRDLQDLVAQNIFRKEGELKSTRYYLIL